MSEFKGTKGDWLPIGAEILTNKGIYQPNKILEENSTTKELLANALLISKAHEMLEFIKNHYRYLNLRDQETAERLIKEVTEL